MFCSMMFYLLKKVRHAQWQHDDDISWICSSFDDGGDEMKQFAVPILNFHFKVKSRS